MTTSKQRTSFAWMLKTVPGIVREYRFCPTRKFRADYALPEKMILIEYDGLISSKSRHTTLTGFSKDCEKFNLAAVMGFRVLRYTALNYHQVLHDLSKL